MVFDNMRLDFDSATLAVLFFEDVPALSVITMCI